MRFRIVFILVLIFYTNILKSQINKTLDNYVKQALENNVMLKQKQLNLEKCLLALKEANGLFYPTVNFNSQYTMARGGRELVVPVADLLNPVYSSLNNILQSMGQTGNFPEVANQKFQFLASNYQDTKLSVTIPIVNAEIYYNRKLKKEMISYTQAETNVYKRELVKDIKTAYLHYLQSVQITEAYTTGLDLLNETLRVIEKMVENQVAGKDKLLRIKAELSQVEALQTKSNGEKSIAAAYFNFLINQPFENPILIDSSLFNYNEIYNVELNDQNVQKREELIQIKSARNTSEISLKMNRSYWIPTISNITDMGYQGYQYKFNPGQQYLINVIDLHWTVFNGFQNNYKIKMAKLNVMMMDQKQSEIVQQLMLQIQQAKNNFTYSVKAQNANKKSLESSKEYYKIVSKQYAENQKTMLELLDARNQLTNSQINYSIAYFETLIKYFDLERVTASYMLTN